MTRRMTVTVDADQLSIATAIRRMADAAPMLVLTGRAFNDLARELGGFEAAVGELLSVAESANRPIAVNMPTGQDMSSTVFLQGWVAGHHQELAAEFGEVTRVGADPGGVG